FPFAVVAVVHLIVKNAASVLGFVGVFINVVLMGLTFASAGTNFQTAAAVCISTGIAVTAAFYVAALSDKFVKRRWHGAFLTLFSMAMILACLIVADLMSPLRIWSSRSPLLLFLVLLTLLNAPFDWVSLGLTRALLRRGLELGGWWPYLLALADASIAGGIIALLALTMVIGVQAFSGWRCPQRALVPGSFIAS